MLNIYLIINKKSKKMKIIYILAICIFQNYLNGMNINLELSLLNKIDNKPNFLSQLCSQISKCFCGQKERNFRLLHDLYELEEQRNKKK